MQIRCLGALEALHDGRTLALGGPKQRLVLAHLLIRANTVVPADRLVDEVWDRRPPPAVPEVTRLTELRAAAIEDRIAAEFARTRPRAPRCRGHDLAGHAAWRPA